ncbi:type III pantothenate kinase [Bdellovibrio reynosensis]|uniref:Type III pantothenate kinase n=1 Tax=Bdellovibrio reynosensis TaxID=2835041 RepID=A0ABY4C743_9BACT|nr:type III pantothenate kinase [Bdellovibrio reynosensis]UOF00720.1 type III pantothenate kinase [Bdellovibrio reynosensis]
MILCLDVGNTQIYAGLFDKDKMLLSFRKNSKSGASSDETGIFLRSAIRENGFDPSKITKIAICSVVPEVIYSLRGACMKYFNINPFILQAGVKTGLKVKYRNPVEVGADRIANSIAATHLYPGKNLILVDLGTATTFCAVTKEKDYLGGSIVAGLRLNMEALESKTAKLPSVEIISMHEALGRSTIESIQSGLFYGHLGTIKELSERITKECFQDEKPLVIGTGGFAYLFEKEKIFDEIVPDLVLKGMLIALQYNT